MWDAAIKKLVCFFALMAFVATSVVPPSYAQSLVDLPKAGTMVNLSQGFAPVILRGMKVDPNDPFRFQFVLDPGQGGLEGEALKSESTKLIRYFLASVTTPEKDLWVNLSPYEQDRIIPEAFGMTEMGRDLLAQDYILKQVTSSLMYPEGETGKVFWAKVYAEAYDKFGTTDVPVDTFNKVWIAPDMAEVYEDNGVAFIGDSHLKVMLESDYLAELKTTSSMAEPVALEGPAFGGQGNPFGPGARKAPGGLRDDLSGVARQIVREVMLPVIEKEVNEGRNFAQLRQVYQSLILAAWYKKRLKDSVLSRVYADRNKVAGVDITDKKETEKIWAQYVEAFKKGAYNYIKEEVDEHTQELIPRKYFSGGFDGAQIVQVLIYKLKTLIPSVLLSSRKNKIVDMKLVDVTEDATPRPLLFPKVALPEGQEWAGGYADEVPELLENIEGMLEGYSIDRGPLKWHAGAVSFSRKNSRSKKYEIKRHETLKAFASFYSSDGKAQGEIRIEMGQEGRFSVYINDVKCITKKTGILNHFERDRHLQVIHRAIQQRVMMQDAWRQMVGIFYDLDLKRTGGMRFDPLSFEQLKSPHQPGDMFFLRIMDGKKYAGDLQVHVVMRDGIIPDLQVDLPGMAGVSLTAPGSRALLEDLLKEKKLRSFLRFGLASMFQVSVMGMILQTFTPALQANSLHVSGNLLAKGSPAQVRQAFSLPSNLSEEQMEDWMARTLVLSDPVVEGITSRIAGFMPDEGGAESRGAMDLPVEIMKYENNISKVLDDIEAKTGYFLNSRRVEWQMGKDRAVGRFSIGDDGDAFVINVLRQTGKINSGFLGGEGSQSQPLFLGDELERIDERIFTLKEKQKFAHEFQALEMDRGIRFDAEAIKQFLSADVQRNDQFILPMRHDGHLIGELEGKVVYADDKWDLRFRLVSADRRIMVNWHNGEKVEVGKLLWSSTKVGLGSLATVPVIGGTFDGRGRPGTPSGNLYRRIVNNAADVEESVDNIRGWEVWHAEPDGHFSIPMDRLGSFLTRLYTAEMAKEVEEKHRDIVLSDGRVVSAVDNFRLFLQKIWGSRLDPRGDGVGRTQDGFLVDTLTGDFTRFVGDVKEDFLKKMKSGIFPKKFVAQTPVNSQPFQPKEFESVKELSVIIDLTGSMKKWLSGSQARIEYLQQIRDILKTVVAQGYQGGVALKDVSRFGQDDYVLMQGAAQDIMAQIDRSISRLKDGPGPANDTQGGQDEMNVRLDKILERPSGNTPFCESITASIAPDTFIIYIGDAAPDDDPFGNHPLEGQELKDRFSKIPQALAANKNSKLIIVNDNKINQPLYQRVIDLVNGIYKDEKDPGIIFAEGKNISEQFSYLVAQLNLVRLSLNGGFSPGTRFQVIGTDGQSMGDAHGMDGGVVPDGFEYDLVPTLRKGVVEEGALVSREGDDLVARVPDGAKAGELIVDYRAQEFDFKLKDPRQRDFFIIDVSGSMLPYLNKYVDLFKNYIEMGGRPKGMVFFAGGKPYYIPCKDWDNDPEAAKKDALEKLSGKVAWGLTNLESVGYGIEEFLKVFDPNSTDPHNIMIFSDLLNTTGFDKANPIKEYIAKLAEANKNDNISVQMIVPKTAGMRIIRDAKAEWTDLESGKTSDPDGFFKLALAVQRPGEMAAMKYDKDDVMDGIADYMIRQFVVTGQLESQVSLAQNVVMQYRLANGQIINVVNAVGQDNDALARSSALKQWIAANRDLIKERVSGQVYAMAKAEFGAVSPNDRKFIEAYVQFQSDLIDAGKVPSFVFQLAKGVDIKNSGLSDDPFFIEFFKRRGDVATRKMNYDTWRRDGGRIARNMLNASGFVKGTAVYDSFSALIEWVAWYGADVNVVMGSMVVNDISASGNKTVDHAESKDVLRDGGIDLNTSSMALSITGDGSARINAIDPAMIARFEAAPGLVPVIISIVPANNLPAFLGISRADIPESAAQAGV